MSSVAMPHSKHALVVCSRAQVLDSASRVLTQQIEPLKGGRVRQWVYEEPVPGF